jgi:hypothetical protein
MRLPKRKAVLVSLAAVVLGYLLFGWLALPAILQSQAEQFVAGKAGHRLSMDRPQFNPLTLALTLDNVRLAGPEDQPLLSFRQLLVDVSVSSLFRRAYVFDAIQLDDAHVTLVQISDERLNWSAFIDALAGPPTPADDKATPPAGPPRLLVSRLAINGSHIDVADQTRRPPLATQIDPIDLELTDLSTLPNDRGPYQLSARTAFGAHLRWQGELGLKPLSLSGHITVDDIALDQLPAAVKPAALGNITGRAALAADYRIVEAGERVDVQLSGIGARLDGLTLQLADAALPFVTIERIEAADGSVDLARRSVRLGRFTVSGGRLQAARLADGRIDLAALAGAGGEASGAPAATPPAGTPAPAPGGPAWHYQVDHIALDELALAFSDHTLNPAAAVGVDHLSLAIDGIGDDWTKPWPLRLAFDASAGGHFSAEGNVVAGAPSADLQVKLSDLALKPAEPWLQTVARLRIASGQISADGRVRHDSKGTAFRGGFALARLRLTEGDGQQAFLAIDRLASRSIDAGTTRVAIRELGLDGLETSLIINKDKSVNLTRILNRPSASADSGTAAPADAAAATAPAAPAAPLLPVSIDRLRVRNSAVEFADLSLALPFGSHIHHLGGSINGIGTRARAPAQVELEGQVDDFGMARAVGQVELFNPGNFTDLKVAFRNVEMTRLTPYSATFAGRKIDSGKLSLDLEYKIAKRQLSGDNRMVVDNLVLGEHVDSPDAMSLPLDLAIALLRDSDGRIDLGLPVSGSLDDPQFSYGQLIWKVIGNVIKKIALAPFRALASLFGGDEKLDAIAFDAGQAALTPPTREKLAKLADALNKRPSLSLALSGTWAEADRAALQDISLRLALAVKLGLAADGDPGPMSTAQPEVRQALETLFTERFGRGELAALQEAFRKANPGQLPESTAGRMVSRLSNALRPPRQLDDKEVAQMKGADFHDLLYRRLAASEVVADDMLAALANARGAVAMAVLAEAGAPMARASTGAPERIETEGSEVALKLDLKPAPATTNKPATDKAAGQAGG